MTIKKWSDLPLITEVGETTKVCVINGSDPSNRLITPGNLFLGTLASTRLDSWTDYVSGTTDEWVLSAKLGYELKQNIDAVTAGLVTKVAVEAVLTGDITTHNHESTYLKLTDNAILDSDFTSTGLMKRGATSGSYSIVTDNSTNWNTAYGWGNHADAGYLTANLYLPLTGGALTGGVTLNTTISDDSVGLLVWNEGLLTTGIETAALWKPLLVKTLDVASTGNKTCIVLTSDIPTVTPAATFGLSQICEFPRLVTSVNTYYTASVESTTLTDATSTAESTKKTWELLDSGTLTEVMSLDHNSMLTVNDITLNNMTPGQFLYVDDDNKIISAGGGITFFIYLPSEGSVTARIAAATEGTDYPTGWVLTAGVNPNDIVITHNLNKRMLVTTISSVSVLGERRLFDNAAFSGLLEIDKNNLQIEGLSTKPTDIVINLLFG